MQAFAVCGKVLQKIKMQGICSGLTKTPPESGVQQSIELLQIFDNVAEKAEQVHFYDAHCFICFTLYMSYSLQDRNCSHTKLAWAIQVLNQDITLRCTHKETRFIVWSHDKLQSAA